MDRGLKPAPDSLLMLMEIWGKKLATVDFFSSTMFKTIGDFIGREPVWTGAKVQLPGETPRPVPTPWAVYCHQCCVRCKGNKVRHKHHCHLHWVVLAPF